MKEELQKDMVQQLVEYLDCPCTVFHAVEDEEVLMKEFSVACEQGEAEGFVPMLIATDDETLWDCLLWNVTAEEENVGYNRDKVTAYRQKMLSARLPEGEKVLEELISQRKEEAEEDDMDWEEEIIGEMGEAEAQEGFLAIWDYGTGHTHPLILAKIPVKNPWEVFAYLPFGNWNECPDTPELMAMAKYWYEKHGAIPAIINHDELEFRLEKPVAEEDAMELVQEQYAVCPDIADQEDGALATIASRLSQSNVWYFWWD